jgi:predicted phosphodiesterase
MEATKGRIGVVGKTVLDYCKRFPATPTRQLARMLLEHEKPLFSDFEHARTSVRIYRGQAGSKLRSKMKHLIVPRIELTEPEKPSYGEVQVAAGLRHLVLADLHIPYHDSKAIQLALDWGKANDCDAVILLGDMADFYALSYWQKDPRRRDFGKELDAVDHTLDVICDRIQPKSFLWKAGNHEYRLERYLISQAPELFGIEEFELRSFLHLAEKGVQYVEPHSVLKFKALTMVHGHEWAGGMSSPVNPARTAYLKCHECAVMAHQHKTSQHTETTVVGKTVRCWSLGCLCNLHPDYAPLNVWNHGFAVLDTRENWRIENYSIINGEVV